MIDRLWCSRILAAGFLGAGATACIEPSAEGSVAPPSCLVAAYRIEEVALAQTWGDAVQRGLDLDGDGDVDNKLGSLNATLTQLYGDWHPEAAIASLLRGNTGWLVRTERCAGSRRVAVSVGVGADGDGDGAFEVADWGEPAIGEGNAARGGGSATGPAAAARRAGRRSSGSRSRSGPGATC